jgi:hypothetical protein
LVKVVPAIAWPLLTKLLPQAHDTATRTQKPKFREFSEVEEEVLTYGLVWESQSTVIEMTLSHVRYDPQRWGALIGAMHNFRPEPLNSTLVALDKALSEINGEVKFKIWDALRKEANRHKVFAETEWALQPELITRIDAIIDQHKPDDPLLISTWLFDDWVPNIPGKGADLDDPMAAIDSERKNALRSIVESKGIQGLVQFAKMVKLPQHVATNTLSLELSRAQLGELLWLAVDGGDGLDFLSSLVVADGIARFGEDWVSLVRKTFAELKIDPARTARLLTGLEETQKNWEIVDNFGVDVGNYYWAQKPAYPIPGIAEDLLFAIEKYLSFERPIAAVSFPVK